MSFCVGPDWILIALTLLTQVHEGICVDTRMLQRWRHALLQSRLNQKLKRPVSRGILSIMAIVRADTSWIGESRKTLLLIWGFLHWRKPSIFRGRTLVNSDGGTIRKLNHALGRPIRPLWTARRLWPLRLSQPRLLSALDMSTKGAQLRSKQAYRREVRPNITNWEL